MSDPTRTYVPETLLAQIVVDYLGVELDSEIVGQGDKAMLTVFDGACGLVTFFDPMSIDEADRIVVECTDGETMSEAPANGIFQIEVGLKTQCAQKTLKADYQKHFDRLNALRDNLFSPTLAEDLLTHCPGTGIYIEFVQPRRSLSTKATTDFWMYSGTVFRINSHARDN